MSAADALAALPQTVTSAAFVCLLPRNGRQHISHCVRARSNKRALLYGCNTLEAAHEKRTKKDTDKFLVTVWRPVKHPNEPERNFDAQRQCLCVFRAPLRYGTQRETVKGNLVVSKHSAKMTAELTKKV
jgi:hypothetical protein